MALTVIEAFNKFLASEVNLDPDRSSVAKSSRDWLVGKILAFPDDGSFPKIYAEMNIFFGSFARKTKIRPLDDIDIMIALIGEGSTYESYYDRIEIHVPAEAARLNALCNYGTNVLNSKRVINQFKDKLKSIPQYKNAEIKRNEAACTLQLNSYEWNFDIVPCFFTQPDADGRTYYLIPDGNGHWKKTDPRIDRDFVTSLNQRHDGNLLNIIRAVKYRQRRPTMPTMQSYLLETMLLHGYNNASGKASQFVDMELPSIFSYISQNIHNSIQDIKGISGDLNNVNYFDRLKIANKAREDAEKASRARTAEINKDMKESIKLWGEIFGPNFPSYG